MKDGLHIIASIPVYKYSELSPSFYKFTKINFVTYSAESSTAYEVSSRAEPIVFVLGITGNPDTEAVNPGLFIPSPRWVAPSSSGFSHGTLAISKRVFHKRLFALLSRVNALTTLVPVSSSFNVQADESLVQQWAYHETFKMRSSDWKPVGGDEGMDTARYEWRYSREWHLHEEGTHLKKGEYLVSCTSPSHGTPSPANVYRVRYDQQRA